jgi:Tfp pilus assembly major pilin PilA
MKSAITLSLILLSVMLQSSRAEEIKCEFVRHSDGYNCEMKTVFESPREVTAVSGDHKFGNGDSDVDVLFINDINKSKYVPSNVCRVFPNIYKIDIYGSSLVELKKEMFEGCTNLSKVVIKYVKLSKLDEDLFTKIANLIGVVVGFTHVDTLPKKLFEKNMDSLKIVDLSFNKLKTINTEFPTTLTMLSVMNNECIDNHFDSRSTSRNNTLPDLLQEIKTKCGSENEGKPMTLTYQEEELRTLKEAIEKNEMKIMSIETSLQNADSQLGMKIAMQNMETRAMKTDIAANNQETAKSIEKFRNDMTTKYEDFFNITSKLNDEARQLKVKLEYNAELKKKTDDLESGVNRNENLIITVFVLQLVLIVFVVSAVVYVKFFAPSRGRIGGGLLSGNHDGTF